MYTRWPNNWSSLNISPCNHSSIYDSFPYQCTIPQLSGGKGKGVTTRSTSTVSCLQLKTSHKHEVSTHPSSAELISVNRRIQGLFLLWYISQSDASWFKPSRWSIVSQHFMGPEGSIRNSRKLSTCSYPEPDQSSPHRPIPLLQDPS
jgi:hypothetical protein